MALLAIQVFLVVQRIQDLLGLLAFKVQPVQLVKEVQLVSQDLQRILVQLVQEVQLVSKAHRVLQELQQIRVQPVEPAPPAQQVLLAQ